MGSRRALSTILGACAIGMVAALPSACQETPRAYPSALVVVDTDLPVPQVISRLQVDVFNEKGQWIEQRQFSFTRREEWPVSFSVLLRDDQRSTDVMLRIRAFSAERDYRGERFSPKEPFVPAPVATSLESLCANAPVLPHATLLVQRSGGTSLFEQTCGGSGEIGLKNATGSVAAYVDIPTPGRYRFEVVTSLLESMKTFAFGTSLHLVKDCNAPEQIVACSHDIQTDQNRFGHLELDLQPGRYALVTASSIPGSVGDVALRWAASAAWGTSELPPPPPSNDRPGVPLKIAHDGPVDPTPVTEPLPDSAVDRLVRLHLEPDRPVRPHIVLSGSCIGVMSKLAIDRDRVIADQSETCVDDATALVRAPIGATPVDDAKSKEGVRTGTFAIEPCAAEDSDDAVVCVPGGAFLLGSTAEATPSPANPAESPVRAAAVHRFFIDRYELTVARYRAAVARGLHLDEVSDYLLPHENDGPIDARVPAGRGYATFSGAPVGREDHPLNFVVWEAARRTCQFLGGDLPTEAQWEYAASFDPSTKRRYPWGDVVEGCGRTVYGQEKGTGNVTCPGNGPTSVTSPALDGDVSFLGIHGLGGNVAEWVLGSPRRYDDPCWRGAAIIDPVCLDTNDAARATRGGHWRGFKFLTVTTTRGRVSSAYDSLTVGFRCAYREKGAAR